MQVTSGTLPAVLKGETLSSRRKQMKSKISKKLPKSVPVARPRAQRQGPAVVSLKTPPPSPAPKPPGLITQFINMVDIAEALSEADKKKEK